MFFLYLLALLASALHGATPTELISSGFIVEKTEHRAPRAVKIHSTHWSTVDCNVIRVMNSMNIEEIFTKYDDNLGLLRSVWKNQDNYYLSYLKQDGINQYGTWIMGEQPNVDNGIAYWKPDRPTLTPICRDDGEWFWTVEGMWTHKEDTVVECIDTPLMSYFSIATILNDGMRSTMDTVLISSYDQPIIVDNEHYTSMTVPEGKEYIYFDSHVKLWKNIDSVSSHVPMGKPKLLKVTRKSTTFQCNAVMINDEFLYDYYRLMLRCLESDEEYLIHYNGEGVWADDFDVELLPIPTQAAEKNINGALVQGFVNTVPGDFVWLWYDTVSTFMNKTEDLLLKCIGSNGDIRVFQYYLTDRKDAMMRTPLSQETDLLVVEMDKARQSVSMQFVGALSFSTTEMTAAFYIGHDIIGWLTKYLEDHENVFGGLPSCFLYHAAIAMPKSLVYAAELLCLILGAKPVVMVQYTTESDHQYKLPLVRELSSTIVAAVELSKESSQLSYRIHKYKNEETIIFYRYKYEYLVDLLLPLNEAQALHIAPYADPEDSSKHQKQYEEQIYNSYWNGYLLGYPQHFVESYCLDFHNDRIDMDTKKKQVEKAKKDSIEHFDKNNNNMKPVSIKWGQDENVLPALRSLSLLV